MKTITDVEYWNLKKIERQSFTGMVKFPNGIKYLKSGLYHREDGPAIVYTKISESWFINGQRHRLDGPAIIYSEGSEEYFINDRLYTKLEFEILQDFMKYKNI